jgi:hypothetical protein
MPISTTTSFIVITSVLTIVSLEHIEGTRERNSHLQGVLDNFRFHLLRTGQGSHEGSYYCDGYETRCDELFFVDEEVW